MPVTPPHPHIAVVGSGPSGCYTAQFILRQLPGATITVFDRLATPFGLVRYGVAPDHQGTKAVTRQFDRLFQGDQLAFAGNVGIGDRLTLEQLRSAFDAVVLATGLWQDRRLGVPGDDAAKRLDGVHGSGRLTRLINGHPGEQHEGLRFGERAVIVGQGNVAIDLVRFLTKTGDQYHGSDLEEEFLSEVRPTPLAEVHLVGRSLPLDAKFDPVMVKELADQPQLRFEIDPALLEAAQRRIDTAAEAGEPLPKDAIRRIEVLRDLASAERPEATSTVHFHFGLHPAAVLGDERVTGIEFTLAASDSDRTVRIDTGTVITAIGFEHELPGTEFDPRSHDGHDIDTGRIAPGLYCVGWLRRGPRGTIPENRKDAQLVAGSVVEDVQSGALALGKPGYAGVSERIADTVVDFAGWLRINDAEIARGGADRARGKIRDHAEILHHAEEG